MKIKLPFSNQTVEINEIKQEKNSAYIYGKKYRFKITDKNGWDIKPEILRDMRIDSLLENNNQTDDVCYFLYLHREDSFDNAFVIFDPVKKILSIAGDNIKIKFNCNSIFEAEEILEFLLEPNGYTVAPVNKI